MKQIAFEDIEGFLALCSDECAEAEAELSYYCENGLTQEILNKFMSKQKEACEGIIPLVSNLLHTQILEEISINPIKARYLIQAVLRYHLEQDLIRLCNEKVM